MARVEIDESSSSDSNDRMPSPIDHGEASNEYLDSVPERRKKYPLEGRIREEKIKKFRTADSTQSTLTKETLLPLLDYPECRRVKIYPTAPKDSNPYSSHWLYRVLFPSFSVRNRLTRPSILYFGPRFIRDCPRPTDSVRVVSSAGDLLPLDGSRF